MRRIERAFEKRKPFIGYLTGGDGGIDYSVECGMALVEGGVDILEIGFPFSDPVADGPVIARAHKRSLEQGTTALALLKIAERLRKSTDVPLVLFSYFNPLLQKGKEYLRALCLAGFDGALIVDLPSGPFFHDMKEAGLKPIMLASPSTREGRMQEIEKLGEGFLYYVSQKGTTGVRSKLADDYAQQMACIRPHTKLPIAAGFGIADRASAEAALQCADGFVVGSAFVKLMEERVDPVQLTRLAKAIDPRVKS